MRHYVLALSLMCLAAAVVWSSTPTAHAGDDIECVSVSGMTASGRARMLEPLIGRSTVIVMENSATTSIVCGW